MNPPTTEYLEIPNVDDLALVEGTTKQLPPICNAADLLSDQALAQPPEVLCGLLHRGCKLILGSTSKARKTWVLIALAVSVNAGLPFWRWLTVKGRVLYINFEILAPFIRSRIQAVARALHVEDLSNLDVWNLRGHVGALNDLLPQLLAKIERGTYSLVIIDPIYKMLGGRDENSAGDMSELCNEVERVAVETGAATAFAAHFAKGNASAKSAMDRISGSGVFARDADSLVILTPHESADSLAVETILRNHPEQEPFVVTWQFPLMEVDGALDPAALKQPASKAGKEKRRPTPEEFLALFQNDPTKARECLMSAVELREEFRRRGWDWLAAPAMRDACVGKGLVDVFQGPHNTKLVGLPSMVAEFTREQTEKNTILEQAPLATKSPVKGKQRHAK